MKRKTIARLASWAALRIMFLYAGVSITWIVASDRLLAFLIEQPEQLTRFQTYKGALFVVGTAALIYFERLRAETKIRTLNRELEGRVERRTAALQAANERLQELDTLKSRFVADVSHELRTPIQNVKMYVDLLRRGKAEKREQYAAVLLEQVTRLQQLVENILDLSRLDRKNGDHTFTPVDLNLVVAQTVEAEQPRAEAAGLSLKFEPEPELPPLLGVAEQLAQVSTNLVANAVNFTPAGQVRVRTYQERDHVCLQVEDTGVGIDPADRPHLYDRFYRGESSRRTDAPGTGLGLSICKEILDIHQGEIEIESEVGQGTTVLVRLPAQ